MYRKCVHHQCTTPPFHRNCAQHHQCTEIVYSTPVYMYNFSCVHHQCTEIVYNTTSVHKMGSTWTPVYWIWIIYNTSVQKLCATPPVYRKSVVYPTNVQKLCTTPVHNTTIVQEFVHHHQCIEIVYNTPVYRNSVVYTTRVQKLCTTPLYKSCLQPPVYKRTCLQHQCTKNVYNTSVQHHHCTEMLYTTTSVLRLCTTHQCAKIQLCTPPVYRNCVQHHCTKNVYNRQCTEVVVHNTNVQK